MQMVCLSIFTHEEYFEMGSILLQALQTDIGRHQIVCICNMRLPDQREIYYCSFICSKLVLLHILH